MEAWPGRQYWLGYAFCMNGVAVRATDTPVARFCREFQPGSHGKDHALSQIGSRLNPCTEKWTTTLAMITRLPNAIKIPCSTKCSHLSAKYGGEWEGGDERVASMYIAVLRRYIWDELL